MDPDFQRVNLLGDSATHSNHVKPIALCGAITVLGFGMAISDGAGVGVHNHGGGYVLVGTLLLIG